MDLETEVNNFLGERKRLIEGIAREYRQGTPAQKIAALVSARRVFSRDQVLEYLRAVKMHDVAHQALADAGLKEVADVSMSGIDTPRAAYINLSADPGQTPDYEDLPRLLRVALAPYLITFAPPVDDEDADVDEKLLGGESVRLVKMRARS
ncbi:hypothetical protein [Streptomyces sp. NPDC050585]|uniref:hypothetical protein n=1 Tax=Streptomyces sp. NPDC050585 TaxID=3365632 RepID=UPI0037895D05